MAAKSAATILHFSDREFMWFIHEAAISEADPDGWVTTSMISDHMGKVLSTKNPNVNVGGRCGYMRTLGLLEKALEKGETFWRLTERGNDFRTGHLRAKVEQTLDALPEGALIDVMTIVARRSMRDNTSRLVVARQYRNTEASLRRR